tara:strand:+ start:550 stop:705 length:156 start_codon:yes stop_codon:yes gene_type:complete
LTEELEHEGKLYQLASEPSGITVEIDGKHWVCVGAKPAKKAKKSKKGAKKE